MSPRFFLAQPRSFAFVKAIGEAFVITDRIVKAHGVQGQWTQLAPQARRCDPSSSMKPGRLTPDCLIKNLWGSDGQRIAAWTEDNVTPAIMREQPVDGSEIDTRLPLSAALEAVPISLIAPSRPFGTIKPQAGRVSNHTFLCQPLSPCCQ